MFVGVVGVPGCEDVVLENSVADFNVAVVDVDGGVVNAEDGAADADVGSSVVEDGSVDVGGLGKVTIYNTV